MRLVSRRPAKQGLELAGGLLLGLAVTACRDRAPRTRLFELLDTFHLYLLVPWAWLGLLAGWLRSPLLGLLASAGGVLALRHGPPLSVCLNRPRLLAGPRLRVLTANVLARNACAAGLATLIERERPDIVLLQEVRAPFWAQLTARVGRDLPHTSIRLQEAFGGAAILSRFPLLEASAFQLAGRGHLCQQAMLTFEGRPLRLLNIHLQTNFELHSRAGLIPLLLIRHRPSSARDEQIAELCGLMAENDDATLICGDFNSAAGSRPYRRLRGVSRDAFQEVGSGLGHSWPERTAADGLRSPIPLLRIDYVFFRGGLEPLRARTLRVPGSDHRAVLADFVVNVAARSYSGAAEHEGLAEAAG